MTSAPKAVFRFMLRNGKRVGISIVGAVLLLAGLVMMVPLVPGPGFVLIILGLAVLASEYAWAQRALEKTKEKAKQARGSAGRWFRRKKKT